MNILIILPAIFLIEISGKDEQDGILKITQDGRDDEDGNHIEGISEAEDTSYITGIKGNAVIGFKNFNFKGITKITITTRAALFGSFKVRTKWDGEVLRKIKLLLFLIIGKNIMLI